MVNRMNRGGSGFLQGQQESVLSPVHAFSDPLHTDKLMKQLWEVAGVLSSATDSVHHYADSLLPVQGDER